MKLILCFFLCSFFVSCKPNYYQESISGKRIAIDSSLKSDSSVTAFIEPYRMHINKSLDSIISYAANTYSKKDGELNTAIGNFMADAVFEQCHPIFERRHKASLDFVLLNHGGIRAIIPKGAITTRTAYNVMPFENEVVVVALKGNQINKMIDYLSSAKRAHPISRQLKIILNPDFSPSSVTVKGKNISAERTYYVATSDYLFNGGDRMDFFQSNEGYYNLNYKVRNILLDNFKKKDTIAPTVDDRFIKLITN